MRKSVITHISQTTRGYHEAGPVPNHLSARAASTSAAARKGVALASHEAETERGPERSCTRELISARIT